MKQRLLAGLSLVCGVGVCHAADFSPPVRLKADGAAIRVEAPGYACPCWADIDGKGKNDLLVGQFRGGKIQIYKNLGDSKFAAGEWLKAGGQSGRIAGRVVMHVFDSTVRGHRRRRQSRHPFRLVLPHGTENGGLFQVLYGNGDGTFRKAEVLKGTDGQPLIIPTKGENEITETICTRPFAVDWDADGLLDLVVGNFSGTFYWFKGEGKGRFSPKPELIMAGDEPLRVPGVHSDPFVVDWDGDGDLDILSGSADGGVYWAENVAGKGKMPVLKQFRAIIKPGVHVEPGTPLREKDLKGPTHAARIWVADVNGDGKLDILVGDSVTLVSPVDGVRDEEMKPKYADWQKEFEKAAEAMRAAGDKKDAREKASEQYQKVYERSSKFMKEEMTGFVWLYLQK